MATTYEKCETCGYVYPPGSPLTALKNCSVACRKKSRSDLNTKKSTKKKKAKTKE